MPINKGRTPKTLHAAILGLALSAGSVIASSAAAEETAMIDCPLRDAPYSIESPLMDILLSQEASAIVNKRMGGVLDELPEHFASTRAPSFSAILNTKTIAGMAGQDASVLQAIDKELQALPVTDANRVARCARYDVDTPSFHLPEGKSRLLVFNKITGFKDEPSVNAASAALKAMAERNGWGLVSTDKGGAINPQTLADFDAVIWNNISGDVLTLTQRQALKDYIEQGGGFFAIHGSGGDPTYFWDWYVDELIGARFIGHPMEPQFQEAKVVIEDSATGVGAELAPGWNMSEEWYSFQSSPRDKGASIVATLDETSYSPVGRGGQDLRMGEDHPIAWARCIGDGRSFYSAIGHVPEVYAEKHNLQLMQEAITWVAGQGASQCEDGELVE